MQHCKRCVMPDTRPGIKFDENGVCYPCLAADKAKHTDWVVRHKEWLDLCDTHIRRHKDQPYDSVLPSSGGKDSHVQAQRMREAGLRPLVVCVSDWFGHTNAGTENFRAMCETMRLDSFVWRQDPQTMREMVRKAFFDMGSPTWPIDAAIYSVPLLVAKMIGVELIVYGEDIAYTYGGPGAVESPSAKRQSSNDVVKAAGFNMLKGDTSSWLNPVDASGLEPVYMSYYFPWDGRRHAEQARRSGFRDCAAEWNRQGFIENFDQIDSLGYVVHCWLKYPKFGHARATDVASNWIRNGYITRDEGVDLVLANDHILDPVALADFLGFSGISHDAFWKHVDTLVNRDLFAFIDERWVLNEPVTKLE